MSHTRRALLVIDVQNEYFTGNLRIEYPDPQRSLANIERAMDAANARGIPVVMIRHIAAEDSPLFARGSHQAELPSSIAQRHYALLIEKAMPSAFAGTELAEWLSAHDINTLTIVGYMTQHCDDSTTKQAVHEGFDVELLSDATGTVSYANRAGTASAEEIHRVITIVMQSRFAAVMTTDEWLAVLASGEAPVRDTLYSSHHSSHQKAFASI